MLFNLYMSSLPLPPEKVRLTTYADDITLVTSSPRVEHLKQQIEPYLQTLHSWLTSRNLTLSAGKSSATIFTTWSKEVKFDPKITIAGQPIPINLKPKILGVTLDGMLSFAEHTKNTKDKVLKRNNILRKVAGQDWGCAKETLQVTYKAIGRSVLNYGAPIWTPSLSKTNWQHLQVQQNSALRTITGCVKMTSIEHLHNEVQMLPVREHSEMLSRQFLVGSYQKHRADHYTTKQNGPRNIKPTLKDKYYEDVKDYLQDSSISKDNYKVAIKKIHKRDVQHYTENRNRIPLAVSADELKLPRITRIRLAQLRSGYSPMLRSYMSRINTAVEDSCPDCKMPGHNVEYLFNCAKNETNLTYDDLGEDLWK